MKHNWLASTSDIIFSNEDAGKSSGLAGEFISTGSRISWAQSVIHPEEVKIHSSFPKEERKFSAVDSLLLFHPSPAHPGQGDPGGTWAWSCLPGLALFRAPHSLICACGRAIPPLTLNPALGWVYPALEWCLPLRKASLCTWSWTQLWNPNLSLG